MTDATAPEGVEPEAPEAEDVETDIDAVEAPEAEEAETDEPDLETDEDEAEQDDDEEPEEYELEYGGNKFRVPKAGLTEDVHAKLDQFLKGSQADYTRKTQEVAEQRKAVEARASAVDQLSGMSDELLVEFSKGRHLRDEIEQLQGVDLNELWQSNPDQARRVSDALSAKQAEFQKTIAKINETEGSVKQAQAAETARIAERGKVEVEKYVKGFNERVPDVVAYVADNYGIPKEVAERDWPLNPATAAMAYKAMMYDRMQAKAARKPTAAKAAPLKPIKGKGSGAKPDPDKQSIDDWMRERNRKQGLL